MYSPTYKYTLLLFNIWECEKNYANKAFIMQARDHAKMNSKSQTLR